MPLFDYRCRRCGALTEVFVRATHGTPSVPCGGCGSLETARAVSRFSFKSGQRPKYSEAFREQAAPFLRSRPGAQEYFAEGSESDEAKIYAMTERIGERVDQTLEREVFKSPEP